MSRVLDPAAAGRPSELVPCSLYSGHYHYGIGALANSLYRQGFRGSMCVGYMGPLPPWAGGARQDGDHTVLEVRPDFHIRFIPWPTQRNLSLEKPRLLLHVLEEAAPQADGALFFDADVTVHGPWSFFEEWVGQGLALCLDCCYPWVPAGHPWRKGWGALAREAGYQPIRDLDYYVNSGFVGVPRVARKAIQCWADLIEAFLRGRGEVGDAVKFAARENAFVGDQDMLNAALMATSAPLSVIGLEGMDFAPAGYTMAHSIAGAKPWRKRFLKEALRGNRPSSADKTFWQNASEPIPVFSKQEIARAQFRIKVASAIGRCYGRS